MRSGSARHGSLSSRSSSSAPIHTVRGRRTTPPSPSIAVAPRLLDHPSFCFAEAFYDPAVPADAPWRARRGHFRLVLAQDFHLRLLDDPANPPRLWADLLWVPDSLAHTRVTRRAGHHFWIVPKTRMTMRGSWMAREPQRIVPLHDAECVRTAVRLYDEFLLGEEALTINLEAHGRYLIGLAHRAISHAAGAAERSKAITPRLRH